MDLSVVIFGAGRFGSAIAEELFKQDVEVLVIDKDYELVQQIAPYVTAAVQCDLADQEDVKALGLSNYDIAIIAIGTDLEASIMATMTARDYKIPRIIAKASTSMQARILKMLGASQVIFPEIDMGERLARSICGKNFIEYIHLSDQYSMIEVKPLKKWLHKTLIELDFRKNYHLNAVAIRRGSELLITHFNTEKLQENDWLLLIGETEDFEQLKNLQ